MSDNPEATWKIARPLERVWIEDADTLIDWELSAHEAEALAYLKMRDGDANHDGSEWAGERVDGVNTRVDLAQNIRAMVFNRLGVRLVRGEYLSYGKLMLADGSEAIRAIPRPAYHPPQPDTVSLISPAQASHYMATGTVHFDGRVFYDVRILSRDELEERETTRARGGRPRALPDLPELALELAGLEGDFPGSNLAENARRLNNYVKTKKVVLSHSADPLSQRAYERALIEIFPPDGKTRPRDYSG